MPDFIEGLSNVQKIVEQTFFSSSDCSIILVIWCTWSIMECWGLVMHGVVPPLSHMPSWCVQGQLNVTFIRLETMSWYILMFYFCDFLSLHSLGTWNVYVSSSSQNIVMLKIMFVSLLCMTLFDMVLCYLTYQVLSCCNFVATVTETETDGQ